MWHEFQPNLLKDISEMSWNKSFDFRARFGAINSASKTKEYLLKNNTIDNRLCLKNKQILELLVPKIRIGCSL